MLNLSTPKDRRSCKLQDSSVSTNPIRIKAVLGVQPQLSLVGLVELAREAVVEVANSIILGSALNG